MLLMTLSASAPRSGSGAQVLERCIAQIAEGDREALAALYRETRSAVYGFALSICKNVQDAEDILQEVYIRVFQASGGYTAHGKPMAWLLTIARNLALMRLREREKTSPAVPEDWQAAFAGHERVTAEDRLVLAAVLDQLSDTERQIVMLHAVSGLKHREIAGLLQLPLPTVLSKYNRALKKLKLAMREVE